MERSEDLQTQRARGVKERAARWSVPLQGERMGHLGKRRVRHGQEECSRPFGREVEAIFEFGHPAIKEGVLGRFRAAAIEVEPPHFPRLCERVTQSEPQSAGTNEDDSLHRL
jgi:hypothetical protein